TVANPVELAERLTGFDDVSLVDRDGSPGARRQIAMWNPPVVDEALQIRRSTLAEAADLVAELVRQGARTICFIKSRKAVELVTRMTRLELDGEADEDGGGALAGRVAAADVGPRGPPRPRPGGLHRR